MPYTENLGNRPLMPASRWLLMTDANCGLGCNLKEIAKGLHFASVTGRNFVLYWTEHAFYGVGGSEDSFKVFFEPISSYTINDLPIIGESSIFPRGFDLFAAIKTKSYFNIVAEDLIESCDAQMVVCSHIKASIDLCKIDEQILFYSGLFRHLRVTDKIEQQVKELKKQLINGPYVAVHIRGGDKTLEQQDLLELVPIYSLKIDEICKSRNINQIFLLTDNSVILETMKARFPHIIYFEENYRNDWCLHGHSDPWHLSRRFTTTMESLRDLLIARDAKVFLGNSKSYFSQTISFWRGGEGTNFVDL